MKLRSIVSFVTAMALSAIGSNLAFAQNTDISIRGGAMYIYGDNGNNQVDIYSPSPGVVLAKPLGASKVNGKTETAVLTGWTGSIYAYLYRGDDELLLTVPKINGALHVDLGQGNDVFAMSPGYWDDENFEMILPQEILSVRDHVLVIGSDGDDQVYLGDVDIRGSTTLDLGSGNDYSDLYSAFYDASIFRNNVLIIPGTGKDLSWIWDSEFRRDLTIDDPIDSGDIYLEGVNSLQNVFLFGSNKNDAIEVNSSSIEGLLKILSKDGDDWNIIEDTVADRIEVFNGSGRDLTRLENSSADRSWIYMENGNDIFLSSANTFSNFYFYGGAGNDSAEFYGSTINSAFLYGEGGTDTLIKSGNTFGALKTYTFEVTP